MFANARKVVRTLAYSRYCLLALVLLPVHATVLAAEAIEIGERLSLRSETLNEDRSVLVYLPESYQSSGFRYPVLYLLDGDPEFLHSVGIVEFLAGTDQIPELIVVGVANTIRSRDLTPESEDTEETEFWPAVGGADQFLEFFREELIPFVDDSYRTVPYRIIRGQSFGGLLAIHDYMSSSPTFNAYFTSSPAVGWNFDELIKRAPEFFDQGVPRPLYVAASGRDFPGNLGGIQRFVDVLERKYKDDELWRFDFFESEGHYSLVHRATYRALNFLYKDWQISDVIASRAQFEDYERHYAQLSQKYGYTIEIPMQSVIHLGNQLLRAKRFEDGIRVLKRNIDLHPSQPESYWHVGDAYILSGQPEKAKRFLETALQKARERGALDLDDYQKSLAELEARLDEKSHDGDPNSHH